GDLAWEARITADALNLAQYSGELLTREFDLIISGNGTLQNAKLQASVTPVESEYRVSGDYGLDIGIINLSLDVGELLSENPAVAVQLEWEEGALLSADNNILFNLENGQLMADYHNEQFTLQAASAFNYDDLVTGNWQINGAGDSRSLSIDDIRIDIEQGTLAGNGFVRLVDEQIILNSTLDWDNLRIPYGVHDLALSAGTLNLSGDIDDYALEITTDVSLDQTDILRLELASTGNREQLNLEPLTLLIADGNINILGMINWIDGINVDLALSGEDLDPGIYQPDWPGNLDLQAGIKADMISADDYNLSIDGLLVSGILRELPIQLDLTSSISPDNVELQDARLRSGSSTIELSGVWGQDLNFDWGMYAPELGMFHPDVSGQIGGSGSFTGTPEHPEITGAIEARNIESPWIHLEKLYSVFDINQDGGNEIDLTLDLANFIYNDNHLNSINISAAGTDIDHGYELDISGDSLDVHLAGRGSYHATNWSAQTSELEIAIPVFGKWAISETFRSTIEADHIDVQEICLLQEQASICATGQWQQSVTWETALKATDLPISLINNYLPEYITATGGLTLDISAGQTSGESFAAHGDLTTTGGEISFRIDEDQYQRLQLDIVDGGFSLSEGVLESNLLVNTDISNGQPLSARLRLT
ncbi:MAG: hypothetical protein WD709_06915, partial [Gammaproteobacteria bacterium]